MKIILLCLACGCAAICFPQSKAGQLKNTITSTTSYKEKIEAYINYCDTFGTQNFNDWLRLSKEGAVLAQSKGDSFSVGVLKRGTGEAFYFKGLYDSAAHYFYTAINLLENDGSSVQAAKSYNALAKLYRKTRDLQRSAENYDKAFSIYQQTNDSAGMAMIWNESGVVYEYANDYDKAIERYTASLTMDRLLKDSTGVGYALSNIAGVYVLKKKYTAAEACLLQALSVRKHLKDSFAISLNYSDLSSAYLAASAYAKAKLYADSSNALTEKMGYAELRQNNFDLLAQVAEKTGDFKGAYNYQKEKAALKDSIFTIEKTKQIEELNAQYEAVKKEQQIAGQQHRIQQQNLVLAASVIIGIVLLLLAYAQYRRYKWKQESRLQAEIAKQQEAATRAVLQAEEAERQRIAKDLHDGVGQMMSAAKMNLSAYGHRLQFNGPDERAQFEKIIQFIDESCAEVRAVSHNMMPNALLKKSLGAAVREFINKLDSGQLNAHLYTEGLEERLDSNTEVVLYRVIQECVNNVIKHAGATLLDINIGREEKGVTVTVEDNGKGFALQNDLVNEGIGLKNIRTRVQYLKGTVDFDSAPGKGTLVAIYVPL